MLNRPPAPRGIIKLTAAILWLVILTPGWRTAALAAEAAPERARVEIAAGWARFEEQAWDEAEAAFRRAAAADPESVEAWRGLAETLLRRGDLAALSLAVMEAIPHLSDDPGDLRPLGEILSRTESTREGAIGIYRIVLDADPGDQALRLELARSLAWSGRRREAIGECRRIRVESGDPDLRFEAALLEAQAQSWRGNQKEAIRIYRELNRERPGDLRLRLGIADSHAWSGFSRRAEAEYGALLNETASPEARLGLGDLALWEGDFETAGDRFDSVLHLRPDDPRARTGLETIRRETSTTISFMPGRFTDSTDWERDSTALFVDLLRRRPVSVRTGAARIRYEEGSGRQIYRTAVPLQAFLRGGRSLSGRAGIAFNEYGDGTDTVTYFLHGFWGRGDRMRVRAGFDHYDMIDDVDPLRENFYNVAETIDVVPLEIDLDELRGGLFVRFSGRLTWDSDLAYADISDGNERWTGFSRLAYRIPARDTVRVFGQLYYQNTSERTPLYFDPSNFQGWGFGVQWQGERAEYFRFFIEATAGYFPNEEDHSGGQLQAWAEWDLGKSMSLRVIGNHLISPEERGLIPGDNYDATYLGLRLVGRIPPRRAVATRENGS